MIRSSLDPESDKNMIQIFDEQEKMSLLALAHFRFLKCFVFLIVNLICTSSWTRFTALFLVSYILRKVFVIEVEVVP
jgi:hypothetical protein